MAAAKKIVAVLFTFSWDGFAVRYADGSTESLAPSGLLRLVGEAEYYRLNKIAHTGGFTGHWHAVPECNARSSSSLAKNDPDAFRQHEVAVAGVFGGCK